MEKKLYLKIRMALKDEILTPQDLTKILTFKTKGQLQRLMDALNEMYSDDQIVPVTIENTKHLMLVRR